MPEPTAAWRTLRTDNLEIVIRWPGGRVPASLIVDDPMPGLNPMIDHEPAHPHRRVIPNAVLHRFADLAERHGLQGKFSVVPWPLALGRLDQPDTLPDSARDALPEFADTVRERIAPRFDLTCEFLTHSRAIDIAAGLPTEETERQWAGHATPAEFADTIALAARILGDVGLRMDGVTSPWDSGADNEAAYAAGIAAAERRRGRALSWYFLHFSDGPDVLPRIAHRDDRSIVVSLLAGAGTDPGWHTQYGRPPRTDALLDADGQGRVADLVAAGLPVIFCTHWQSLYGNGSYGGLHAIDTLGQRLRDTFGDAIEWTRLQRHAEMAAACATLEASENVPPQCGGSDWSLCLQTPYPSALADVELRGLTDRGRQWLARPLRFGGTALHIRRSQSGAVRVHMPLCDGVLAAAGG